MYTYHRIFGLFQAGEDEHGAEGVGVLLEASGDAAPLLEAVEAVRDDVPASIALAVEGERVAGAEASVTS